MKKISIILLVLLLNSCIDYSTLTEFVIENKSEYEVKIQVSKFETEFYYFVDTIFTIVPNSKIHHFYEQDGEGVVYEYPFGIEANLVTIHFNDTVSSEFTRDMESNYNLLRIENYSGGKIEKGYYKYTYTLTNEDFQEALKE